MTTNGVQTNGATPSGLKFDDSASTDIVNLALDIVKNASEIKSQLAAQGAPAPSFAADSADIPDTPEQAALRGRLMTSLEDLRLLVNGPRRTVRNFICTSNDLAAMQVAVEFNYFTIVPETEQGLALEEIAQEAGMDIGRTRQILRLLCTHRIFKEVKDGYFAHTALSALFKRDDNLRAAGGYGLDEMFKAAASTADTVKAAPQVSDLEHSPFKTGLGISMFEFYEQNPAKANRFAKAMAGVAGGESHPQPFDSASAKVFESGNG